jgi:hypothetical protein
MVKIEIFCPFFHEPYLLLTGGVHTAMVGCIERTCLILPVLIFPICVQFCCYWVASIASFVFVYGSHTFRYMLMDVACVMGALYTLWSTSSSHTDHGH